MSLSGNKGPANKRKGSRVEREFAELFRAIPGLELCKTTRHTSRVLDNCKVDLNFLPILVQIKAGAQRGLNPSVTFREMVKALADNLPASSPEHGMPKILIHHKDAIKGKKRHATDDIVSMTLEDWMIFFKAYLYVLNEKEQQKPTTK